MASSSASTSMLRDLCRALAGDFVGTFSLVERGGQTELSGKENGEAMLPLSKAMPSTSSASSTSSSPADNRDALDAALDDADGFDRALTSRRHRRTRHRLRARMETENASSNPSDSSLREQLSAIASLGATAAFLEAAARVLTGGAAAATAAATIAAEACAFGWELSRLLEEYRECVLELEASVVSEEEEEEAAEGNEARASSSSALPLPAPRIRIHLGEWPVVLEEVAALAELALECMDEEEEEEGEEKEGDKKKKKRRELLPSAVPPAAALARAAAALARCGAPRVEAAAARISAAIERAQLLALADWCCCAEGGEGGGGAGGFWVVSRRRPETVGGEEEEEAEAEESEEDSFSSFELVPAALPPFLSAEAARDALFVGCAARAFSSREGRSAEEEWDGYDGGGENGDEDAGEETRRALLSLLSSSSSASAAAAPEQDDSRELLSTTTLRPTAVASVLAGARDRAERRLFRRCCLRCPAPLRGGDSSSSLPLLRAALESLRRVALLGDAALWGAALRSGNLRAALEKKATESGGGGGNGGGKERDVIISSALEAAADDARGAATPAALEALFSSRGDAPLRLAVVLISPEKELSRRGKGGGKDGDREEALWSRLRVRRKERPAWPLGLLPLFSSALPLDGDGSLSSSSCDPWRTIEALFSTLLALERASLALEEAYLLLKSAARGKRAPVSASAGSGIGGSSSAAGTEEDALLSLWRAHRDAAFAVRGALSHLREDVLAPADGELDAALLRLQQEGWAGAGAAGVAEGAAARPWTLAAAALGRWRSRVASSSLLSLSPSVSASSEALGKLCRACHAIRSAVELASLLEEGEEEEEQRGGGDARALAAASASVLLGAAAGASEAARALAAAAAAEASTTNDGGGDDFAASHRAMLLGRVSFG